MSTTLPPSPDTLEALKLLLRWIQHGGGLRKAGRVKVEALAETVGLSRKQLDSFLIGRGDRLDQRYTVIAERLWPILEARRDLPKPTLGVMEAIYGPLENRQPLGVIDTPRVLSHRALAPPDVGAVDQIHPLEGLNVLVRRANESVPDPDRPGEADAIIKGWSIAVLNVPPKHVQEGAYHPVFKLIQVGLYGGTLTIEGVVLVRGDRLVLQGIELGEKKSFTATVALSHDRWQRYRPAQGSGEEPVTAAGIMLGLSSSRGPFAGLFELFAVPRSVLVEEADEVDRQAFDDLYKRVRAEAGVRDLAATLATMQGLGIPASEAQVLRLREAPLLRAF